ncbi:helix-turn-helix transcriptional regulator [Parabacteroides sp. AF39-10AC]|nr:helix-turn-helix transcriptional regulator [Parabacteroides sp. AF39-10AC]
MLGYSSSQKINRLFIIDERNNKYPTPSSTILSDISNRFDIDPSWLMTGEGNKKKVVEAIPIDVNCILNVPLVNQYAYAGYLCGYADAEYIETLPTIPFIVDHEAHGHYIAFEVRGDSMNDGTEESYLEGDRLLCREIKRELWIDSKLHIRKWDFVIVHKEGVLIKRIVEHNVENGTITVHSLNPIYPDKVISLAEVYQIFNVIEFLRPKRR